MPIIAMPQFSVIKGGREDLPGPEYSFVEAFVTDTRLMGVVGLMVHWLRRNAEIGEEAKDIYMFFYYDIEELGLDSISVYELCDAEGVALALKACFGGLGAEMLSVSEKDARYLICKFVNETKERHLELPAAVDYLGFVLNSPVSLTEEELDLLDSKMCTALPDNFSLIHYYLMRSFGKDNEGLELLRPKNFDPSQYDDISHNIQASFLKNSVEVFYNNDGRESYLSESLVEADGHHYIYVSEIRTEGKKVVSAKKKNSFEISLEEASLILSRGEYVNVYRILCPLEDFDIDFAPFSIGTTHTSHLSGEMFMEFKPDNKHVNKPEYKIYEDIQALYFVTDYGELIVAAYTIDEIRQAEEKIRESILAQDTALIVKVQLARSVIYDFAESGFTSFGEFIRALE